MANCNHIVPFILRSEGGWSNTPGDAGGETNKGITYTTWQQFFGATHDRFMEMTSADWTVIFKKNYWDQVLGDQINSQRISDFSCDWIFNCGKHFPEIEIQEILVAAFGSHIGEDGDFGPATIIALNAADEPTLWNDIVAKRISYYKNLAATHPNDEEFLNGWENRVKNLQTFEATGELV